MTTKLWLYAILFSFTITRCVQAIGQSKSSHDVRTNPLIGIALSATDFTQLHSTQKWKPGFHLHFLNGINTKYDYVISIGCLPIAKAFDGKDTTSNKTLLLESGVSLQQRFLPFHSRWNVWAAVGVHGYYLNKHLYPGLSVGPGADLRLDANTKLQLSASYLLNHTVSNGWRLQLGLYGTLKKRKPVASPPAIVVLPASSDRDGDGITDEADRCPDQPGLPAFDGCPDTDLDDIPDDQDSCVTVPGVIENNGCPLVQVKKKTTPPTPVLSADSITTLLNLVAKNITFANNEYAIDASAKPYLAQIAYILGRIQYDTLYVTGHTDAVGSSEDNQLLSERRAEAVKQALMSQGIPAGKIIAAGKGETMPMADNDTPAGRQLNRRTEFRIQTVH